MGETFQPKMLEHQPSETERSLPSPVRRTGRVKLEPPDNYEVLDSREVPAPSTHDAGGETVHENLEEPEPGCSFWGLNRESGTSDNIYSRLRREICPHKRPM